MKIKNPKQFLGGLFLGLLLIFSIAAAPSLATRYFASNVVIDGVSDAIQLRVQGYTTQTANLLTLEQSDGTDVLTVTNTGALTTAGAADFTYAQAADAAATGDSLEIAFTSPVDTAGTQTHNALTVDLAIGNSTAGTNTVTALQIDAITDDPQVVEKAINIGDEWDYAIDTGLPIVASAAQWWDDFFGDTVNATYAAVSGTDGQAVQAIVVEQFGVYQLTSGDAGTGTAADLEGIHLGLEWQPDQGALVIEARLHLDTAITTARVCVGFTDDSTTVENSATISVTTITTVASDAVVFCYDTYATTDQWYFVGVAADTDATGNAITGVAPTANVYQVFRIEIDDGCADARGYIDGVLVGTLTADACTATTLLSPFVSVDSADTAASQVVDIDYLLVGAARD